MTERLARSCSRHPGRVIAIWIVVVLASFPAIGLFLGDVLTADVEVTSETESRRADRLLERAFPETRAEQERELTEAVLVRSESGDAPAAGRVAALARELEQAGAAAVEVAPGGDADVLGRAQRLLRRDGITVQDVASARDLQHHRGQAVSDGIMEVARGAPALGKQRLLGELAPGGVELRGELELARHRPADEPREYDAKEPDRHGDLPGVLDHRHHDR